jgi:hypothetical protein
VDSASEDTTQASYPVKGTKYKGTKRLEHMIASRCGSRSTVTYVVHGRGVACRRRRLGRERAVVQKSSVLGGMTGAIAGTNPCDKANEIMVKR